ncbi:MAG: 4Fe-4S dicluster domain-containing protein [Deltaproteobacteria bacterium]|nr:4Fe-4S dicluster domain-containing protein [Deltaproteobacteria bacterium]
MSLFNVNPDTCNRDGLCVDECPVKIIMLADKKSLPVPVPGAEDLCVDCGHCVAVCPTGALSHRSMTPEQCLPVKENLLLDADQAEHFLRYRRSIRTYRKKPVEKDILSRLVGIASYAPSGHNVQPVCWRVVHDRDEVRRLTGLVVDWMRFLLQDNADFAKQMHMDMVVAGWDMGIDSVCRDVPHLIIAHGLQADPMAQSSCTIALTYLDLAAPSLGLGTCWAGFFHAATMLWPPLQEALNLPDGHACMGAMMVGYPKYKYKRMPVRNMPRITWV